MLVQEGYTFSWSDELNTVEVQFPDGKVISLATVNPINIGLTVDDTTEEKFIVTLITKASLMKVQKNITTNLEVLGFKFRSRSSALLVLNFLCANMFISSKEDTDGITK